MQPGTKIGILGGGQLARMLVQAGQRLGLEMWVLSENPSDPAAQVTRFWQKGSTHRISDIKAFSQKMTAVTFESEFVPALVLENLDKKKFFPDPCLLRQLQDRLSQKQLLCQHGISTSPFLSIEDTLDLEVAMLGFDQGCVLKKRLGGYDGKGTFILRTPSAAASFTKENKFAKAFIAEKFIRFKKEMAVQVGRNRQGQITFLPLVEISQKDHRLDFLVGPAHHPAWPDLQKKIRNFIEGLGYVGVLAFELFDTGKDLVVNEIAPRVHNSGHYSIEALNIDQFQLHLLCGLGLEVPPIESYQPHFAMTNLIGAGSRKVNLSASRGHLHWYGKAENSVGRKIGHVTYLGRSTSQLLKLALSERKRMKL